MAIHEACQVWIEQRIEEELDSQPDSGKSYRQIGREIAKEVEKVFEAKVKPETLKEKARRMQHSGTFVPPGPTPGNHLESGGNQTNFEKSNDPPPRPAKDGTQRGGWREGAGRPTKTGQEKKARRSDPFRIREEAEANKVLFIVDEKVQQAFDSFHYQIQRARLEKWENTSKEAALRLVELVKDLIEV